MKVLPKAVGGGGVLNMVFLPIGVIQVLRNAVGGRWVSAFPEKSITKVYGSMLLALREGGWGQISREKALRNT